MTTPAICATPGCNNHVAARQGTTGRPPTYCSPACRLTRKSRPQPDQTTAEADNQITVDINQDQDASDHPGRSWVVTVRRGQRSVIVGRDLGRFAATALTGDLHRLLNTRTTREGDAID